MTKNLPEALADHGQVIISRKQVARLIGQVFLQRSAVNLLGVVLDVPEFFWSSPDHLQVRGRGGTRGGTQWRFKLGRTLQAARGNTLVTSRVVQYGSVLCFMMWCSTVL